MTARQPFLIRHAAMVFALKTFAAAILALLLALWMDLPRPYWAMATVYIASQPLSGATRSKAFYRVGGTIIGAIAAVAMVPPLVNAPELLCLAIALWVGLCLYISLLDRSARSYLFMLSGYTAALIAFPVVSDPASVFDTALARVEEITLGIVCASLVATIILPRAVGPAVAARIDNWLHEARSLTQGILSGKTANRQARDRRVKLAADAVDIELLADHLSYDPGHGPASAEGLRMIHRHMLALLPLLSSIADRLEALGADLRDKRPKVAELIDSLSAWLTTDNPDRAPADALREAIKAKEPALDAHSSWNDILLVSLLLRLRELVDVSHDCRVLQQHIAAGKPVSGAALAFRPEGGIASARHRDHGMALWSAGAAIAATLLLCAFWIGTGWADGASAPLMAAIGCSFFASQDDPAPGIKGFGVWSVVAMAIVAFYLFAVLPMLSHIEMVILTLAPRLLAVRRPDRPARHDLHRHDPRRQFRHAYSAAEHSQRRLRVLRQFEHRLHHRCRLRRGLHETGPLGRQRVERAPVAENRLDNAGCRCRAARQTRPRAFRRTHAPPHRPARPTARRHSREHAERCRYPA